MSHSHIHEWFWGGIALLLLAALVLHLKQLARLRDEGSSIRGVWLPIYVCSSLIFVALYEIIYSAK
jgi:hypothetical protein